MAFQRFKLTKDVDAEGKSETLNTIISSKNVIIIADECMNEVRIEEVQSHNDHDTTSTQLATTV